MSTTKSILCDHCAKILKGNHNKFTYDGLTLCLDCYHTALMNDNVCSSLVSDSILSAPIIRQETDSVISTSIIREMLYVKNNKKQKELIDKMTLLEEELNRIKEELNCVKKQSKKIQTMSNSEAIQMYENND